METSYVHNSWRQPQAHSDEGWKRFLEMMEFQDFYLSSFYDLYTIPQASDCKRVESRQSSVQSINQSINQSTRCSVKSQTHQLKHESVTRIWKSCQSGSWIQYWKFELTETHHVLQGIDKNEQKMLKKRRRTLKNRGYAKVCRVKRVEGWESIAKENEKLKEEIHRLREIIRRLQNDKEMHFIRREWKISFLTFYWRFSNVAWIRFAQKFWNVRPRKTERNVNSPFSNRATSPFDQSSSQWARRQSVRSAFTSSRMQKWKLMFDLESFVLNPPSK